MDLLDVPMVPKTSSVHQARIPRLSFAHYSYDIKGYDRLEDDHLLRSLRVRVPSLQQSERKFFKLILRNDLQGVKQFLRENHGFNINCVNYKGVSALLLAVQNRSEIMTEFLLRQRSIDVGDSLLHAISNNQISVLKLLLEKLQEIAPGLEFVGSTTHSPDFADHITPLILAAQRGHFEIIKLLIERGHKIPKLHLPNCSCHECLANLDYDSLQGEVLRINLYKAITNPAYICNSSHDPILTAFELSRDLSLCARMVPEFRLVYLELAHQIRNFAVELIACCRSTEEMDLILKQRDGVDSPCHFIYPRLLLAMRYKQKEFVAHPNTQLTLEIMWRGDFHEWKFKSLAIKFVYPFFRIVFLPIVLVFCLILPKHSLVKQYSIPLNKMLSKIGVYLVFLLIIFLESNVDEINVKRGPPNSGFEPIIILFVCSIIWHSIRICLLKGPGNYFSKLWNWFDMLMYVLYILTFSFWIVASIDVRENDQADLERKFWYYLDPTLIAEGTFAIAVVMSYFRLIHLARLHYFTGPLHTYMGMMFVDSAKYLVVYALLIISFTCGTCRLYNYYEGMIQIDEETGLQKVQSDTFVNFFGALKTYFWGVFTMSDLASNDVVVDALPGELETTPIVNEHRFTQSIGYVAFAIFEVLVVIILKPMLVATLSTRFEQSIEKGDVDWIYGRTAFYIDYMDHTVLPPPLNLVPTAYGIGLALEWLQLLSNNLPGSKARFKLANCCFIERKVDKHLTRNYQILMSKLILRYFSGKNLENQNIVTKLELLKQEIGEIKYLLKESLAPD